MLQQHIIPIDAIERRIESLEIQDNDYFVSGTEFAVTKIEGLGFTLPEYDPVNYPIKEYVSHCLSSALAHELKSCLIAD